MKTQPSKSTEYIEKVITDYGDMLFRLCFVMLKNNADAEDAVQETIIRYMQKAPEFADSEHEKAWLIVTASNLCKDSLKKWWRKTENIDDHTSLTGNDRMGQSEVMEALMSLKKDYKTAVYMYYYEGYTTAEIAEHLNCPEATVRSRLSRARKQLKTLLGGDAG